MFTDLHVPNLYLSEENLIGRKFPFLPHWLAIFHSMAPEVPLGHKYLWALFPMAFSSFHERWIIFYQSSQGLMGSTDLLENSLCQCQVWTLGALGVTDQRPDPQIAHQDQVRVGQTCGQCLNLEAPGVCVLSTSDGSPHDGQSALTQLCFSLNPSTVAHSCCLISAVT